MKTAFIYLIPWIQIIYVREAVVAAIAPHNNLASPVHDPNHLLNNTTTFNTLDSASNTTRNGILNELCGQSGQESKSSA